MANIMSMKNLRNNVHRNGFDLSFRNIFTAKVGQLLPVFCKPTLPGDKWSIDLDQFTRIAPVQTAAYTRVTEYYDFYFVPMSLLWDKFDNYIVQTNNYNHASSFGNNPSKLVNHPYFTVGSVKTYLKTMLGYENGNDAAKKVLSFDEFGMSRYQNAVRLLSYLGYGNVADDSYVAGADGDLKLNPFPLLAYQKICQDYFRFQQWETASPYLYNLDYVFNNSQMNIPVSNFASSIPSKRNFFDLNYANYKKDMFTGLLPSKQFGDTAIASPLSGRQRMGVVNINPVDGASLDKGFMADLVSQPGNAGLQDLGPSIFALRFAEAAQRWKEVTNSGNLDFKEQIQKHWNVNVSDDQSYMCKWLGGRSSALVINEVVNNNISSEDSQALIAGRGLSSSSHRNIVNYNCNQYGYIIGIYHAEPLMDWAHYGIDRNNMRVSAEDYAIPEFDSLGMEELPKICLDSRTLSHDPFGVLGYAPRYIDYKTSYDVVNGGFLSKTGYSDWSAPRTAPLYLVGGSVGSAGDVQLRSWFFKISPASLDRIFLAQAAADSSVDSDYLLASVYFNTHVVRNLSVSGLPY